MRSWTVLVVLWLLQQSARVGSTVHSNTRGTSDEVDHDLTTTVDGVARAASTDATLVSENVPDVESHLRNLMDRLIQESLPRMTALGFGGNVTGDCSAALFRLLLGVRKFEPWALRLVDANSRPPGGLISGTFNDLGTFDQCVSTTARDADGEVHFSGQYCTLYLQPRKLPFFEKLVRKLHEEVYDGAKIDFFKFMYNDMAHGLRLGVCYPSPCSAEEFEFLIDSMVNQHGFDATVKGCVIKEKMHLGAMEKGLLYLMASCVSFLVVGSLTDIYLRKYGKQAGHDLKNLGAFYKMVVSFSAVTNTEKLLAVRAEKDSDAKRLRFLHGMRFLSAVWVILGHSYLTIEPTAVGEMLRIVRFGKHLLWCLVGNAYPSVQTFLFMSRPKLGFLMASVLVIGTSTAVSIQAYLNSYQPIPIYGQPELDKTLETMAYIYYRPHVHVASYAIGIMLGYVVLNHSAEQLHRLIRITLWLLSSALALLVVFGPFKWLRGDPWVGLDAVLYAGFGKAIWALVLAWITFSCACGRGGFVTRLLSWKALVPLSRLSYGAYLVHSPLYLIRTGIMRERMSLQHFHLMKDFFGCVTLSFLLAYLLFLLCEAPVASLEKMLLFQTL
ncbi:nose resistant to fluoxetine protein 6, partial [Ixodes scapularis]|uniref:nose resistant to fluoxetine protein 6 n=1 Tax=Ixodes scapularis TaxID=6945 RepID=UPI001C3923DE